MIEDYKKRIDGLNMYYRIAGSPKSEPIIFLHGWGSRINPLPFTLYKGTTGVIEELANYFYVFAPELPGLLRSDAPKAVWNYEEFAKIIYILALSIGWEKSIIMGQSFGGGVATAFAKLYPDYTKALVIVDSVVSDLPMNSYWVLLYKWARFRAKVFASVFVPQWIKKVLINLYFGTPMKFLNEKTIREKIIMSDIVLKRNLVVDYSELKMPFIMVWGDKDTWVTPLSRAEEIHREVKNSKLITVEGGHPVLHTKPKEVIAKILKTL